MVRSRVNRKQTVFVLGAGMSAACGAPLTSDFLTTRFSHYFTAAQLDLINRFASRASLQGEPPTIEDIWVRVDNAILGTPVPGYDQHALRATRNALRDGLIRVFSAVHFSLLETMRWCGLDEEPLGHLDVESFLMFLTNPLRSIRSRVRKIQSEHVRALRLFEALHRASPATILEAMTAFFSPQAEWAERPPHECAEALTALLSNPIKPNPIGIDRVFHYRCAKARSICGPHWLGSGYDSSGKICQEILWDIYLLWHYRDRLEAVRAWFDSHYRLTQMLRRGDTVITTNYDLFLELALLSLPSRPYPVLWGTEVHEVRDKHHCVYVPGTTSAYSRWEAEGEGFTQSTHEDLKTAEASGDETELRAARQMYKRALRRRRQLGDPWGWVSVLKLHGSLDWGLCENCETLFAMRLFPFYTAKATILAHRRRNQALKRRILCCDRVQLTPLIIPPTHMKDYDNKVLVSIWSDAIRRLAHSTNIVFLGYSLPAQDERMRHLFRKASYERGGAPWKVTLVDLRAHELTDRYQRIFGEVVPVEGSITNYLNQCSH